MPPTPRADGRPVRARLTVLLLLAAAAVVLLPTGGSRDMAFERDRWAAPFARSQDSPIPISDWGIDLRTAEAYALALPFDDRDEVLASPDTAELLRRLSDWFASETRPTDRSLARARLALILPSEERARAFTALLDDFYAYRSEEVAILSAAPPGEERAERLAKARRAHLGADRAEAFFPSASAAPR